MHTFEHVIILLTSLCFQRLLSFSDAHIANQRLHIERPETQCERWFSQPWDEIVAAHLRFATMYIFKRNLKRIIW